MIKLRIALTTLFFASLTFGLCAVTVPLWFDVAVLPRTFDNVLGGLLSGGIGGYVYLNILREETGILRLEAPLGVAIGAAAAVIYFRETLEVTPVFWTSLALGSVGYHIFF